MAKLRVISGLKKGRKFVCPEDSAIRPTKNSVREAVFNIIQGKISGAKVLDLFSGSGAYGIEALSRNAKECLFVEEKFYTIIKENCNNLAFQNFKVLNCKVEKFLNSNPYLTGFDLIFADPPYDYSDKAGVAAKLFEKKIIAPEGFLIFETETKFDFGELKKFIYLEKIYGITKITIFSKGEEKDG